MPWHVTENHDSCPTSRPWAVVKDVSGEVEGCHPTRETANDQLAALYAAEADQELQTMATDIVTELGGKPNPGTSADKRLSENDGCPEGQHRSDDGDCVSDEMDAEVETFHPGHNQRSHGGGKKGGPPKIKPAGDINLPNARQARDARRKDRQKIKDKPEQDRRESRPRRRRRSGGPPQINPEAERIRLPTRNARSDLEQEYVMDDMEIDTELTGPLLRWEGILAVEGVETGDGREFAPDSIEWPDTADIILPLMWQEQSEPQHGKSIVVGRIEHVERLGDEIHGAGVIMADAKVTEQMQLGVAGGVSVDVDSIKDVDVEFVYDDEHEGAEQQDDIITLFGPKPEKTVFHRGRLRGATLVALPAFVEARLHIVDEASDALLAAAIPVDPPHVWFQNPVLRGPTPWTVTDEGQVFGHMALWSTCHQSIIDRCITPPRESDFPYFMRRELKTFEGDLVGVGPITMGTSHASTRLDARPAAEHYDNTGTAVVDVVVGQDRFGIWIAGALRPHVDAVQLRELRGAALSGDWRRIGGQLRLVAILAVNVPGFPIPRMQSRADEVATNVLVAAGIVTDEAVETMLGAMEEPVDTTIRVRRIVTS